MPARAYGFESHSRYQEGAEECPVGSPAGNEHPWLDVTRASIPNPFQHPYGLDLRYVLLLGGYFNERYLGYNASEGIDWIWEHRIEDLIKAGL
ncbi:MAG: XamI family restriction endonuclease [bacterium]|nr:XamI family restriction endonuclease [bacterium]